MIFEKKKHILFAVPFVIAFVTNFIGVISNNVQITSIATPSIFIALIVLYVGTVKKINWYVILYFILVLLSEFLLLRDKEYFSYSLVASAISQLVIIMLVMGFRHVKYKDAFYYFIPTIIFYIIMYFFVITENYKSIVLVIFGIINSVLIALIMANYIQKMYWANYLLFLSAAFKVLNYAIISINISDASTNIYAFITDVTSHSLLCLSFILRVNRPAKNRRHQIITLD